LLDSHSIVWADRHTLAAVDTSFTEYLGFAPKDSDSPGRTTFHAVGTSLAEIFPDIQAVMERFVNHEFSPSLKNMDTWVWSPAFV
jgi:hypothetical protein